MQKNYMILNKIKFLNKFNKNQINTILYLN